jgi:hypothetical protein
MAHFFLILMKRDQAKRAKATAGRGSTSARCRPPRGGRVAEEQYQDGTRGATSPRSGRGAGGRVGHPREGQAPQDRHREWTRGQTQRAGAEQDRRASAETAQRSGSGYAGNVIAALVAHSIASVKPSAPRRIERIAGPLEHRRADLPPWRPDRYHGRSSILVRAFQPGSALAQRQPEEGPPRYRSAVSIRPPSGDRYLVQVVGAVQRTWPAAGLH